MIGSSAGIVNERIHDTPIAVLDFETTGMRAGPDRVVEVSVVRVEPGGRIRLALDSLVNPQRRVGATWVHGITDADVAGAPTFRDLAGDLVRALAGCVVAAYNVYFDLSFLAYELESVGVRQLPPHLCLMYLRPTLGLGRRCSLGDACAEHAIRLDRAHATYHDTMASAELMALYLREIRSRGLSTFGELARLHKYKFFDSFARPLLTPSLAAHLRPCGRMKSRAAGEAGR